MVLVLFFWLILPTRDFSLSVVLGAATFLLYSLISRFLFPTAHRAGLEAFARKDYDKAISRFWESYEFFSEKKYL